MKFSLLNRMIGLLVLSSAILFQSCDNSSDPVAPGQDGYFVVNEGGFGNGNTSISFFDRSTGVMTNDVFARKNGRPLGDQAQSMAIFNGKGYIVVQGSKKIEVINPDDFASLATITTDITNPRYFLGISSTKAYVSDWGADGETGTIKVIDLTTNTVTKTVSTGKGANKLVRQGDLVYVANSGGYGSDNTIAVINTNTDAVTSTITVGDNPNSLQLDKDGNIWVTASGNISYNEDWSINEKNSTKGSLSKIAAGKEVLRLTVDRITSSGPSSLNVSPDGATLYYTFNGAVYALSTTATALPTTPFKDKDFYGLAVDPFSGNVIGCEAPSFSSSGKVWIYNAAGVEQGNYTVGIGPNGCTFK